MAEPTTTTRKDGTTSQSWGDATGSSAHREGCACVRCSGFTEGKPGPALDHGGYATVSLRKRIAQIADEVRILVPGYSPSDEAGVLALARYEARMERLVAALEWVHERTASNPVSQLVGKPADEFQKITDALDRAEASARRMRLDLGLTPEARFRLGLTAVYAAVAAQRIDIDRLPIQQRVALRELVEAATVEKDTP